MNKSTGVLYLAGPMTGIPEHNFPLFNQEAARLRNLGWTVLNPAEFLNGDTHRSRIEYVRTDMAALLSVGVQVVALLPGWEASRGAFLEAYVGALCGMSLMMAENITAGPSSFFFPVFRESPQGLELLRNGGSMILSFPPPPANGPSIGLAARKAPRWEKGAGKPETICEEANRIVNGGRQGDYGHPMDDMTRTAALWTALRRKKRNGKPRRKFKAEDVARFMIAVKLSRDVNLPRRDNAVDMAGYAQTRQMIVEERERRAS